ncbi:hypothetical protein KL937_002109 [Ogataea polymorpha]|nr:hypothetical protein KL937_002109 [Ogataea polymorpha]KAG7935979.1 hypothetical protein KL904_002627 [Ogataea polymorpha]
MTNFNVPGGFPSLQSQEFTLKTPPRSRSEIKTSTPSSTAFRFTPTNGKRLYPSIVVSPKDSTDCDTSYQDKENPSFTKEMDFLQTKLFSSKLTSSVLNEFNDRYQKVRSENIINIQKLNNTSPKPRSRRPSTRFNNEHRGRFNRMESISTHYAARRTGRQPVEATRKIFEGPEQITRKTPNDKRLGAQDLGSASKRLRVVDGYKEIVEPAESPTRPPEEKKKIMEQQFGRQRQEKPHLGPLPQLEFSPAPRTATSDLQSSKVPSYLQPTKASIQRSESKQKLKRSETASYLPRLSNIVRSKTMQEISPSRMNSSHASPHIASIKSQSALTRSTSSNTLNRKSSIPQLVKPAKKDYPRPWRN